jgi:hypothetical protein
MVDLVVCVPQIPADLNPGTEQLSWQRAKCRRNVTNVSFVRSQAVHLVDKLRN